MDKKKNLCVPVANCVDLDLTALEELFVPIMVCTVCHLVIVLKHIADSRTDLFKYRISLVTSCDVQIFRIVMVNCSESRNKIEMFIKDLTSEPAGLKQQQTTFLIIFLIFTKYKGLTFHSNCQALFFCGNTFK